MQKRTKNIFILALSSVCASLIAVPFVGGESIVNAKEKSESLYIFRAETVYATAIEQENIGRVGFNIKANELVEGQQEISFYFGEYANSDFENAAVVSVQEDVLTYTLTDGASDTLDCNALSRIRDGVEMSFYYDYFNGKFEITRVEDSETIVIFSQAMELPIVEYMGVKSATDLRVYDYLFYTQDLSNVETKSYSLTEKKALYVNASTTVWSEEGKLGSLSNVSGIDLGITQGLQISFDVEEIEVDESMSLVFSSNDNEEITPSDNINAEVVTWTKKGWNCSNDTVTSASNSNVADLFQEGKTLRFVYAPAEKRLFAYTRDIGENSPFQLVQTFENFYVGRRTLYVYLQFDEETRISINQFKVETLSGASIGLGTEEDVTGSGTFCTATESDLSFNDGVYTLNAHDPNYFYWSKKIKGSSQITRLSFDIVASTFKAGNQCGLAFGPTLTNRYLYEQTNGAYAYYMYSSAGINVKVSPTNVTAGNIFAKGSVILEIDPETGVMKILRKGTDETDYRLAQTVSGLSFTEDLYFAFQFQCAGTLEIADFRMLETNEASVNEDITGTHSFVGSSDTTVTKDNGIYTFETTNGHYVYWDKAFDFSSADIYRVYFDVLSTTLTNNVRCGFTFAPSLTSTDLYNQTDTSYIYYKAETGIINATAAQPKDIGATDVFANGKVMLEMDASLGVFNVYRLEGTTYELLQSVSGVKLSGSRYFGIQFHSSENLKLSDVKVEKIDLTSWEGYLSDPDVINQSKITARNLAFDSYQKEYKFSGYLCNMENMPLAVGDSVSFEIKNIVDVSLTSDWFGFCFGNKAPTDKSMFSGLAGNYYYGWYSGNRTHVQYVKEDGAMAWLASNCFLWNPTLELPSVLMKNTSLKITYCQQSEAIAVIRIAVDTGNGDGYREIQRLENLKYSAGENFWIGLCSSGTTTLLCDEISVYKTKAAVKLNDLTSVEEVEYFEDYKLTVKVSDETMADILENPAFAVAGKNVRVSVKINDGYVFTGWTDESGKVLSASTDYEFEMPFKDYTLTANVEKAYKVVVLTKDGGTENVYWFRAGEAVRLFDLSNYAELKLTGWTAQGVEASVEEDLSVLFEMPSNEVVLTAIYDVDDNTRDIVTQRVIPGKKELIIVTSIICGGLATITGGVILYYFIKKRRNG